MPPDSGAEGSAWRAVWRGVEIARSDRTVTIENSVYFPPESVRTDMLAESAFRTRCPWKGEARYFSIRVGEAVVEDAAWSYPAPRRRATRIKDWVAFWKDVAVERIE